jgi:hypothetical protein
LGALFFKTFSSSKSRTAGNEGGDPPICCKVEALAGAGGAFFSVSSSRELCSQAVQSAQVVSQGHQGPLQRATSMAAQSEAAKAQRRLEDADATQSRRCSLA